MNKRTLAFVIAAFLAGGCIASLQLGERLDDLTYQNIELRQRVNELRDENLELEYLLEEGR